MHYVEKFDFNEPVKFMADQLIKIFQKLVPYNFVTKFFR